ncbi:putative ribosomal protein L2, domain 2 [Helianthus annuus]|nr:putative ribosomal protein L2, domain 2 [Helianthus annuus]
MIRGNKKTPFFFLTILCFFHQLFLLCFCIITIFFHKFLPLTPFSFNKPFNFPIICKCSSKSASFRVLNDEFQSSEKKKKKLTRTRDLPTSNRSRRRRHRFLHRRRHLQRLLVIKKLLTHRITQLQGRQSVTKLRNLIITKPKPQIKTPFKLIKIFISQTFSPHKIIFISQTFSPHSQTTFSCQWFRSQRARSDFKTHVVEVSTSKTGKHGHAKCHFVAIDIFNGKKLEDIVPSSHNCDVPHVSRTDYQLIDISEDGFVSLLTENGNTKDDLKLPTDDTLLTQIKDGFAEGKDLVVSVMSAMGEEQICALKDIGPK